MNQPFSGLDQDVLNDDGGSQAARAERLAAEIDPRLADVWLAVLTSAPGCVVSPEQLAWLLRMAYLAGYSDALSEPQRGLLFRALGAAVPGGRGSQNNSRRTK